MISITILSEREIVEWNAIMPMIETALQEDLPWGDVTSEHLISPLQTSTFVLILKQEGVLAGIPVAEKIFQRLDSHIGWTAAHQDGEKLSKGTILAEITGTSQVLLQAERVALNFLQRLSGIATLTSHFVEEAKKGSDHVRLVDTRKTTPGLRYLEKYAVRMGGGSNHRFNLSDAVMIKDNHLAILSQSSRPLKEAVAELRGKIPHTMRIEIEIDTLDQLEAVLEAGAEIILLDNMSCEMMRRAVEKTQGRALLEASGGVTLETVREIAATGVDIISVGALTHSAPAIDISLDLSKSNGP